MFTRRWVEDGTKLLCYDLKKRLLAFIARDSDLKPAISIQKIVRSGLSLKPAEIAGFVIFCNLKLPVRFAKYQYAEQIHNTTEGKGSDTLNSSRFLKKEKKLIDREIDHGKAGIATVEGLLDHTSLFSDPIGGNYPIKGLRYLIKGYFRFGSSGAPYLTYDPKTERYAANAIQSEASPIQLTIDSNREGNYQFVNAIATPLHNVKEYLSEIMM